MKIQKNLFDLTPDQESTSKMMYNGKIIKCLVAPYHSYDQLEKQIEYTKTTYLFPERELPVSKLSGFISMIVNNPSQDEFRIVTSNQNIILDMVDTSVRILTEGGDIVDCPCKTFMANIHDIRYKILENKSHQVSPEEKTESNKKINELIKRINSSSVISKSEYDDMLSQASLIGEPIISNKLRDMIGDLEIK